MLFQQYTGINCLICCPVLQGEGNSVEERKVTKGDGMHKKN
jgi:hypothetical protein